MAGEGYPSRCIRWGGGERVGTNLARHNGHCINKIFKCRKRTCPWSHSNYPYNKLIKLIYLYTLLFFYFCFWLHINKCIFVHLSVYDRCMCVCIISAKWFQVVYKIIGLCKEQLHISEWECSSPYILN